MSSFGEVVIAFYRELDFTGRLPEGISIMNPFRENPGAFEAVTGFYSKYYNDRKNRHMILGINPGRFGAGVTGIPFTDTVRLKEKLGLTIKGLRTYETSSVFVYDMIDKYGGPEKFYTSFYISSVSPLGFTFKKPVGKVVNYNYYDSKALTEAILSFAVDSIKKQIGFGIDRDVCFCLGSGKNFKFLLSLNNEHHFFDKIEPLEHPRFIMQYRSKEKSVYINKYIEKLSQF